MFLKTVWQSWLACLANFRGEPSSTCQPYWSQSIIEWKYNFWHRKTISFANISFPKKRLLLEVRPFNRFYETFGLFSMTFGLLLKHWYFQRSEELSFFVQNSSMKTNKTKSSKMSARLLPRWSDRSSTFFCLIYMARSSKQPTNSPDLRRNF